jgi:hypothetical protein
MLDAISITGCWEGALLSDHGGHALSFSLRQPPRSLSTTDGPTLCVGAEQAVSTRVLDGAARTIVALAEGTHDPESGRLAHLLVDARVRGDRLIGRWLRRDDDGRVLASGHLSAGRTSLL